MQKKNKFIKSDINNFKFLKNIDQRPNEMPLSMFISKIKTEKTENRPIHGDRFIPQRRLHRNDEFNKKFYADKAAAKDLLYWDQSIKYWLKDSMIELLDDVFNIKEKRILKFSKETDVGQLKEKSALTKIQKKRTKNEKGWLCRARRKPYAYAESTHDSVGFSDCFERNMMDWSVNGQVVASFADDVIIWRTIRETSITFRVESISCLAYCPNGKYLAIGCKVATFPVIELWDISKYGVKVKVIGRYFFNLKSLKITSVEWSKCGKFLFAGTKNGIIYVLNAPHLKIVHKVVQSSKHGIVTLCFSIGMRYLAAADTAGNVIIYSWSNLKLNVHLRVVWKRKTRIMLDWHPWNGVYQLAIAESKPASVVILNVPSKTITSFYRRKNCSVEIDALAFNKITAELCLSISKFCPDGYTDSKILVLESLDRVVDVLTIEYGARFLMFSPDGTRLVTAGNDNSLTIWNFIYSDEEKKFKTDADLLNKNLKQALFYGCDRGQKFQLWSNVR